MKNSIKLILLLVAVMLLFACSDSQIDEKKFYDTYKQILLIREANADTTIANPMIREIFEKNKYPKENFQKDYFELAKDPKRFVQKIDSIRNLITK
jgi:predicted transcriptional regulator